MCLGAIRETLLSHKIKPCEDNTKLIKVDIGELDEQKCEIFVFINNIVRQPLPCEMEIFFI